MFRKLDSRQITATLETLRRRIAERFPSASLAKVCAELIAIAGESRARTARIVRPDYVLRAITGAVIAGGLVLLAIAAGFIEVKREGTNVYGILQGIESGFNIILLMGAAVFFLVTLETRLKRRIAMEGLHELRSIVHVIDMHQLTKDPTTLTEGGRATESSPRRTMSAYDLGRYLDYCSEMLSLIAKVAALYAQSSKDPVVVEAVSDIGQITTNLSNKIWQKITLVQRMPPELVTA
jgi:hypothetical protein